MRAVLSEPHAKKEERREGEGIHTFSGSTAVINTLSRVHGAAPGSLRPSHGPERPSEKPTGACVLQMLHTYLP